LEFRGGFNRLRAASAESAINDQPTTPGFVRVWTGRLT
jgi:hypothetical protein